VARADRGKRGRPRERTREGPLAEKNLCEVTPLAVPRGGAKRTRKPKPSARKTELFLLRGSSPEKGG